jgi:hypothetical protein
MTSRRRHNGLQVTGVFVENLYTIFLMAASSKPWAVYPLGKFYDGDDISGNVSQIPAAGQSKFAPGPDGYPYSSNEMYSDGRTYFNLRKDDCTFPWMKRTAMSSITLYMFISTNAKIKIILDLRVQTQKHSNRTKTFLLLKIDGCLFFVKLLRRKCLMTRSKLRLGQWNFLSCSYDSDRDILRLSVNNIFEKCKYSWTRNQYWSFELSLGNNPNRNRLVETLASESYRIACLQIHDDYLKLREIYSVKDICIGRGSIPILRSTGPSILKLTPERAKFKMVAMKLIFERNLPLAKINFEVNRAKHLKLSPERAKFKMVAILNKPSF